MTRRALVWSLVIAAPVVVLAVLVVGRVRGRGAAGGGADEGRAGAEDPGGEASAGGPARRLPTLPVADDQPAPAAQAPGFAPPVPGAGSTAAVPGPTSKANVNAQINTVLDQRLPTLTSLAEVDKFLGDLQARARARGSVTAADVQPGMMALRALAGKLPPEELMRRQADFSRQMATLGRDLNAGKPSRM